METNAVAAQPSLSISTASTSHAPIRELRAVNGEADLARDLAALVALSPARIVAAESPHPLLDGLRRVDAELATRLILLGAVIHRDADERRTAEYLLRHRVELGVTRTARSLVRAARCAAEMDVRRVRVREMPTPDDALTRLPADATVPAVNTPSVGDIVLELLARILGMSVDEVAADRIRDAVVIALELAERHALMGGVGPSLLAMRPDARRAARLVSRLRPVFGDPVIARSVARLLIGGDGTSIETAVLWWAARGEAATAIPDGLRCRWLRDLAVAGQRPVAA
jgi:hypothetical protein